MSEGRSGSDFAELLRELKNRSGQSYGTLAKRLHLSTSTLHRYCNGDGVPADYAPVERLARLCKATPEELVELHRRWVRADAERGRKEPLRKDPARRDPEPVREPGAAAESASESVPGPVAEPEPGPASEPVPLPVPVPESGSASGAEPVSESGPVPGAVAAAAPGAAGAGSRRRRRRTVLLAALTVTALLGTVAVALNLPSGDGKQDGRGPAVDVGAAARDHAPVTPPAGSSRPSGSATPSAPPSAKDPATPSGTPEDRPSVSGAGRTPQAATPPLTVTTRPYTWESPCSPHYLIDRPPSDVSPPPLEQDAPAWVDVHKAVSAKEQYVTFTVQGTGKETVVLEGLSVRMAGKRSPLAWNDYAMGYPGVGCGGGVPTRSFTVALDAMRPAPVPEAGGRNFPFKVSQSDPEVFHVLADASAYDVSWYLELSWSSGARHGTLVIDDAGRPFRTSGSNGRPAYAFPLGGQKWRPAADFD
ncbi:helix-turn-helix domain-containing protein [Streptomyces actinomycinicus]|uniref:helix-turn-helix domain-containing protein n=1 Tax=Streptomyces actinomycinicus TaxID=1695166 RepID=UPI0027DA3C1B|nr:helix-turn-helix domain-containing protein [Streptomyces actinomycinicus]